MGPTDVQAASPVLLLSSGLVLRGFKGTKVAFRIPPCNNGINVLFHSRRGPKINGD